MPTPCSFCILWNINNLISKIEKQDAKLDMITGMIGGIISHLGIEHIDQAKTVNVEPTIITDVGDADTGKIMSEAGMNTIQTGDIIDARPIKRERPPATESVEKLVPAKKKPTTDYNVKCGNLSGLVAGLTEFTRVVRTNVGSRDELTELLDACHIGNVRSGKNFLMKLIPPATQKQAIDAVKEAGLLDFFPVIPDVLFVKELRTVEEVRGEAIMIAYAKQGAGFFVNGDLPADFGALLTHDGSTSKLTKEEVLECVDAQALGLEDYETVVTEVYCGKVNALLKKTKTPPYLVTVGAVTDVAHYFQSFGRTSYDYRGVLELVANHLRMWIDVASLDVSNMDAGVKQELLWYLPKSKQLLSTTVDGGSAAFVNEEEERDTDLNLVPITYKEVATEYKSHLVAALVHGLLNLFQQFKGLSSGDLPEDFKLKKKPSKKIFGH